MPSSGSVDGSPPPLTGAGLYSATRQSRGLDSLLCINHIASSKQTHRHTHTETDRQTSHTQHFLSLSGGDDEGKRRQRTVTYVIGVYRRIARPMLLTHIGPGLSAPIAARRVVTH